MEKIKYFIPDIEDFHISYEYEVLSTGRIFDDFGSLLPERKRDEEIQWRITKMINPSDLLHISISYDRNKIRCAYLTKEQIEAEGWKFKGKSVDLWWEKEGEFQIGNWTSYKLGMHYGMFGNIGNQDLRLYIYAEDQGHEHTLFEGECKSINEFRYICKLLKI